MGLPEVGEKLFEFVDQQDLLLMFVELTLNSGFGLKIVLKSNTEDFLCKPNLYNRRIDESRIFF